MRLFQLRPMRVMALLMAVALVAAACGDDDDESTEESPSGEEELSGEIVVSGSSTVQPITALVGEAFSEQRSGVTVTVDGPGTGDGFQLFCEGSTDVSDASRAIEEEEVQACEAAGIEYVELQVGIDGLAVMTNEANDAVTCLTFADIYGLVGPESEDFDNWQQAEELAGQIGSTTDLPDTTLTIFGPGEESGTFDSFVELALEGVGEDRGQEDVTTRPDYNSSANDNEIIAGIQSEEATFGWVGFAFADQAEGVTLLEVDGGDGCVEANAETIASAEYPLSRPLFIYVNTQKAAENPSLTAFVDFYLSDEGIASVGEADYVDLESDKLEETRSAWESAKTS